MDQHQTLASAFAQRFQPIRQIVGGDEEDTAMLQEMANRAHRYLGGQLSHYYFEVPSKERNELITKSTKSLTCG